MGDWQVRVTKGPAAGQVIELDRELTLGRAAAGAGRLGEDPELSREHARLSLDARGQPAIEDRGSSNGTVVNGERLKAPRLLTVGDRITVGKTTLVLERSPAAAGATRLASRDAVMRVQATAQVPPAAAPAAPASPAADEPEALEVVRGPAAGATIRVGAGVQFGRESSGPGQLQGDPELSRRHARITRDPAGVLVLEDVGSTNGTYLNGWRIPAPQALSDGDQISLGQSVLRLTGVPIAAAREAIIVGGEREGPARERSGAVVLKVEGITKSFGERQILKGVDLEIRAGEVVGLLGPNGAGKSTLVSIVAGLKRPNSGQVTINGVDVVKNVQEARRHLGIAPQDLGIYPTQTVRRNLEFFGEISGLRGGLLAERVQEVGEALSLATMFDRKAAILSGGQKRRLHAGMAMLHHPSLLILDEPTVGADIRTRQEILDAVKHLASEGRAICYSTHYLPEIEELGASVAILDNGQIGARGSIAELVARHSLRAVELTFEGEAPEIDLSSFGQVVRTGGTLQIRCEDPPTVAAAVLGRLGSYSERLRGVEIVTPSLDSVYLALTKRRYSQEGGDVAALPPPVAIPAGWYPDPAGRGGARYWDGQHWTEQLRGKVA
jgi:ABC-2 type transport system ATP-binding protein